MPLKTGKLPATDSPHDLLFANYRTGALPRRPRTFGHERPIPADGWGMLGNGPDDTVAPGFGGAGDCVFAGGDHETIMWLIEGGMKPADALALFNGETAISDYSAVTNYVIGDESTDQGTNVRDALSYRRKTGLVDVNGNRHKIGAFVKLDEKNLDHILEAMWLFGAVGIGIEFPDSAMDQFNRHEQWSVVPGAQIEGGHYIVATGRRAPDDLGFLTWGRRQSVTQKFYETYADEAWAAVSVDELRNGVSRRGLDLSGLVAALQSLGIAVPPPL